ncbi:MAG: hypothetical protein AAGK22_08170, partial [Acidobacteriota bacterium]
MNRFWIPFLLALTTALSASSSAGAFVRIRDADTGQTLALALVEYFDENGRRLGSAQTDSDGRIPALSALVLLETRSFTVTRDGYRLVRR